jgi:hypothetical protein
MILTFDQAGDLLDQLAEGFPEALFEELNGGVNLLEDAVPDLEFPEGDMYVMGEFCDNLLGRYINLYYGSFAALAEKEDWTEEDWRAELRQTLSHELTHHMEGRSGLHALDDKDEAEMAAWQEEYGESNS